MSVTTFMQAYNAGTNFYAVGDRYRPFVVFIPRPDGAFSGDLITKEFRAWYTPESKRTKREAVYLCVIPNVDNNGVDTAPYNRRRSPDTVFLASIKAMTLGQGRGSKCLQWLSDLADAHGVKIAGFCDNPDFSPRNQNRLRKWYMRFGFDFADENNMRRAAKCTATAGGACAPMARCGEISQR